MQIAEIFSSLQGEGRTSGYPTLFIRLAGCNLNCSYCDTPASHERGTEISVSGILTEVMDSPIPFVCITGGEPLLQNEELLDLLRQISSLGKEIVIETNGTIDFRSYQAYAKICMDVKCPSSGEESDLSLLRYIRKEDSVKFVIGSDEDLSYASHVLGECHISGEIFFSPVHGTDYQRIASYILKENAKVRMQVQLHKIIGMR